MKAAELEGTLLDYWVARAEGWAPDPHRPPQEMRMCKQCSFADHAEDRFMGEYGGAVEWYCVVGRTSGVREEAIFSPSCNWAHGGPIIERERISFKQPMDGGAYAYFDHRNETAAGPTALIAAMRAYVASKFGDEVPDSDNDAA